MQPRGTHPAPARASDVGFAQEMLGAKRHSYTLTVGEASRSGTGLRQVKGSVTGCPGRRVCYSANILCGGGVAKKARGL
jgi:hypothetical protein